MKILQINKFFYLKGGSEEYFFELSRALEAAGHEVIHFSMQHPRNEESPYADYFINEIDFQEKKSLRKAGHFLYSTEAAKQLEHLVRDTKPDIAHLHNIAHQLTPSIINTLKRLGVPMVQTLHDYQLICPNYQLFTQGSPCERCNPHKYWEAIKYKCVQDSRAASALSALEMGLHNVLLQTYKNGVDRFIAPSQFLHDRILAWGWNQSQITYLPHFVNVERDSSITKKKQIAFVGRLTAVKGAQLLLDAAKMMNQSDIQIIFAGEGEANEQQQLQQFAQQHHLTNCIFLGHQTKQQVYSLMQESAAIVVPSLWYENAPLVVYEALALGTPVIAANHGGLPELVQDGKNGYLFTPANAKDLAAAILRLFQQTPLQIPQNRYTESLHLQQLMQLYEDVIHPKNS